MSKAMSMEEIRQVIKRFDELKKENDELVRANEEIIKIAHEIQNPKADQLDDIIDKFESAFQQIRKTLDAVESDETISNVRQTMDKNKGTSMEKLDYAIYVEGGMEKQENLAKLQFSETVYDLLASTDPLRLIGELRVSVERRGNNIKEMVINHIPLDKELLEKMPFEERLDAFKGVFYDAIDELKEVSEMMPNTESLKKGIKVFEAFIQIIDLVLLLREIYEAAFNLSLPPFRGLDTTIDRYLNGYIENGVEIKGIKQYKKELGTFEHDYEINQGKLKIITDKISLQQEILNTNATRITQQEEKSKSLDMQIAQKERALKEEGDEDDEEEK